jgi:hypothetical protein
LAEYSGYSAGQTGALKDRMIEQLIDRDEDGFNTGMRQMFAHIPYQLHIDSEAYYHSLVLLWINLLGFEVQGEVSTNTGRIDAVWQWHNHAVVAEVKYQPDEKSTEESVSKLLDEGMAQIKNRRYYERYIGGQNHVTLLAIAFAGKRTGCRMEDVMK